MISFCESIERYKIGLYAPPDRVNGILKAINKAVAELLLLHGSFRKLPALFVAALVGHRAGCLACRLACCLTFAAATLFQTLL
jgi:hypothetical protein